MDNREIEAIDIIKLLPKQSFLYLPILIVPIVFFYEYVYFVALGLKINQLPITFFDHIKHALIWMPEIVLFFLFSYLISLLIIIFNTVFQNNKIAIFLESFFNKTKLYILSNKIIKKLKILYLKSEIFNFLYKSIINVLCFSVLVLISYAFFYEKIIPSPITTMCFVIPLWSSSFYALDKNKNYRELFSVAQRVGIRNFFGLLFIVYFYGYSQGAHDFYEVKNEIIKSTVVISTTDEINVNNKKADNKKKSGANKKKAENKKNEDLLNKKIIIFTGELGVIWYDKTTDTKGFVTWDKVKYANLLDKQLFLKETMKHLTKPLFIQLK